MKIPDDFSTPMWSVIRWVVVALVIIPVLYKNATTFDETEIKSIITFLGSFGIFEGALQGVRRYKGTHCSNCGALL